jgi:hypothetical protein
MKRPIIIQAPSEDPRDKAIESLIAMLDHDRNLESAHIQTLEEAIKVCRLSQWKDGVEVLMKETPVVAS